jgi:hypothetical protein
LSSPPTARPGSHRRICFCFLCFCLAGASWFFGRRGTSRRHRRKPKTQGQNLLPHPRPFGESYRVLVEGVVRPGHSRRGAPALERDHWIFFFSPFRVLTAVVVRSLSLCLAVFPVDGGDRRERRSSLVASSSPILHFHFTFESYTVHNHPTQSHPLCRTPPKNNREREGRGRRNSHLNSEPM